MEQLGTGRLESIVEDSNSDRALIDAAMAMAFSAIFPFDVKSQWPLQISIEHMFFPGQQGYRPPVSFLEFLQAPRDDISPHTLVHMAYQNAERGDVGNRNDGLQVSALEKIGLISSEQDLATLQQGVFRRAYHLKAECSRFVPVNFPAKTKRGVIRPRVVSYLFNCLSKCLSWVPVFVFAHQVGVCICCRGNPSLPSEYDVLSFFLAHLSLIQPSHFNCLSSLFVQLCCFMRRSTSEQSPRPRASGKFCGYVVRLTSASAK